MSRTLQINGSVRPTRRRLALGLAGVLLAVSWAGPVVGHHVKSKGMDTERIRAALRAHPLRTLAGQTVGPESLEGQVVVLNFWASWCTPCRRELPRLEALHTEISRKGGRVLAISIDHEKRNAQRFARNHDLTLPICHDGPDGLARTLDLPSVPFTIVLDRSGAVAFTTSGADDHAIDELGVATRRLVAAEPYVSRESQGGTK